MAYRLIVSTITPPDGLAHTDRKTEIMELPSYLRVTTTTGLASLKFIFIGTTPPDSDNNDNIWLKTDEAGTAHGFYRWDAILGVWLLMAGPGVIVGTTKPDNENVLWLKTDAVNAVLTTGWAAVLAPQGLYQCVSGTWACFTSTPMPVMIQATAPTPALAGIAWLKTVDEKGVWYWDGAAWVCVTNISPVGVVAGVGVGASYAQVSGAAPLAAIRPYTLWVKTGALTPNGLFWPDVAASEWVSVHPITIGVYGYGPMGMVPNALYTEGPFAFSILASNIGTAYFPVAPNMIITLTADSQFASGGYINIGATSTPTTFSIAGYHESAVTPVVDRNVNVTVTATGIMRIPF